MKKCNTNKKVLWIEVKKVGIFKYGQTEIDYLSKKDKKLKLLIDRIGMIKCEVISDIFAALVSSIVGQQISNKAAETVWSRLCNLLCEITPRAIANKSIEEIQKCGMTMRKAGYIKAVAEANIDYNVLHNLTDDEIIKKLTAISGVGVWTAEMLLIFSLQRQNVLSFSDLAIRRGLMNLYGLDELTKEQFNKYKKQYSPYGTVASLYLWELSKVES